MDEPWQIYYEELIERGEEIPDHEANRAEDMTEAAKETHESVVDRLVNQLDFEDSDAVALARSFGRAVKEWIAEDVYDWEDLLVRLEERQVAWEQSEMG
jgi:hypothetical protein